MGIVVFNADVEKLSQELKALGWKEGRFNGEECLMKEEGSFLWVVKFSSMVEFLSLPVEESSELHTKGMGRLKDFVENLSNKIDFTLPGKSW